MSHEHHDRRSLLMHQEAVRMIEANPELAGRDLYCGINFDDKKKADK